MYQLGLANMAVLFPLLEFWNNHTFRKIRDHYDEEIFSDESTEEETDIAPEEDPNGIFIN